MKYIVYTDGAYSQDKSLGGSSYLIITDTEYISSNSTTLMQIGNPTNAETVAVGSAASYLLNEVKVTSEDVVEFHIDCLSTVTFCNKNARASGKVFSNNQKVIASIKIIRKLAKTCEVTFEKVRGHKSVMNPNTVVDRLAKLAIRRD